jgi:iron complex transport system ATP-binding protein
MNRPVLRLDGVSVRMAGSTLLDGVDWAVGADDRWVVLGPNGAGKTTLLRVAALHLHPSAGVVTVLGQRLGQTDVRRLRTRIGLVSPALTDLLRPTMTARDLVVSALHGALVPWWLHVTDDDRDRATAMLARFEVLDRADRAFATLSSGERQRVLLARALVTEPDLVLFDEPMAGLDLGAREALIGDLAALAADGAAPPLVLVTHHAEEIPPGFTDGLLLDGGRVVAAGPLDTVMSDRTLSAVFGLALEVDRDGGRWRAVAGSG